MGIIVWIILGLVAGMLVKTLMPGEDLGGIVLTIALGIAGALVCGLIAVLLGIGGIASLDMRSLAMAVVGGILLPFGYRCLKLKGAGAA